MTQISETDLILNEDGSIYHLNLLPGDLATTIISVGDPDRVAQVSCYFDSIELKKQKREFITHTGYLNNKRISVLSTGISTDNIDIVFNEMDALFNIDFTSRTIKKELTPLKIIRIGTAGGLQADIPLDSSIMTRYAVGLDGLLPFYQLPVSQDEQDLLRTVRYAFHHELPAIPYVSEGSAVLRDLFKDKFEMGITATCAGFYAPQGRFLRAPGTVLGLAEKLSGFKFRDQRFTNFEMETAAMYGLGRVLGHECCSLSAIVANRITKKFSQDPKKVIDRLIQDVLSQLA
ncbi:MAG: nucleoside phosphorylase [Gammaproteobacteria bacterium]|nr:nucleoside phosphorylase [Gammaproteobacteria bacterium]